jgi:hypothetical protein
MFSSFELLGTPLSRQSRLYQNISKKCLKNLKKKKPRKKPKTEAISKKGSKIVLEKCFKMNADFEVYSFILFMKLLLFLDIFEVFFEF